MTNRKPNGNQMGKGKGKLFDEVQEATYREPFDSSKNPGSVKKNRYLMAVMRDNRTWCFAKIIDVRVKVPDEDETSESITEQSRGHHRD